MDLCVYTKLSNLMWQMTPLHIQTIHHELNKLLLHINTLSFSNEKPLDVFLTIACNSTLVSSKKNNDLNNLAKI